MAKKSKTTTSAPVAAVPAKGKKTTVSTSVIKVLTGGKIKARPTSQRYLRNAMFAKCDGKTVAEYYKMVRENPDINAPASITNVRHAMAQGLIELVAPKAD